MVQQPPFLAALRQAEEVYAGILMDVIELEY